MKRYKTIIDDWEGFKEACKKPATTAVRKNHIKAGEGFENRLLEKFNGEISDWNPDVYRLETDSPGKSLMYWIGEYYVQEESASMPVEVMEPEEGETILDMCAAPGGKSTQIAAKMMNKGVVVANDDSSRRLKSLHANTYRTGSACIMATNYDGRRIPGRERFDRILVDAPCSGEADKVRRAIEQTEYKDTDVDTAFLESGADMGEIKGLAELQKQLLERAAELLKPGGTLVYSTCTFAPEENEEVVLHGVENTELELEDIETSADHTRGLTSFEDREYREELTKTIRIYPHHFGSGGMYVAKFVKPEGSVDQEELSSKPRSENKRKAYEYMQERFGVDIDETKYVLREISGDIWIVSEDLAGVDDLEFETKGIRFIRMTGKGLKPTTYGLQLIEEFLDKNVVEIEKDNLVQMLKRKKLVPVELEDKGYVAVKWKNRVIGCGFYMDGTVSSRVPKGRSKELVDSIS